MLRLQLQHAPMSLHHPLKTNKPNNNSDLKVGTMTANVLIKQQRITLNHWLRPTEFNMKFSPLPHNNACLVTLPKQVVMSQTPTLRAALTRQLESGTNRLIVDLHEVEYIDSSGLSILISALKVADKTAGEVVLLSPTNGVRALIELTQLHQIFTIFENKHSAIEHVCSPSAVSNH